MSNAPSPISPQRSFATLVELLRWRAVHQPSALALSFLADGGAEVSSYTYQELDERSRAAALCLQDWGVSAGERVLLLYPQGLEYVVALLGCFHAGAIAVPAYPPDSARPAQSMPRLLAIARDAGPRVIVGTSSAVLPFGTHGQSLRCRSLNDLDLSRAAAWQPPVPCANSPALLQYTSGSTSSPRGAVVTHGNLMANLRFIRQTFEAAPEDVAVIWLPPYHDMGLIGGILGAFYCGNPLTLLATEAFLKRPLRWLETISRKRAVISGGPNFAYDLCVRRISHADRARLDLSSWAVAFTGAEPVRAATIDRFVETFAACGFRREAFFPCYGLAEATLMASGGRRSRTPVIRRIRRSDLQDNRIVEACDAEEGSLRVVGCGKCAPDQRLVIVDPDTALPRRSNEVGEIWLAGASVVHGYWNCPLESQSTFNAFLADTGAGPYLRTGDLGFVQDDELFITGRLKDLVIFDGRNHYAEDLEQTIENSHPALRPGNCVAFSIEADDSERLVILVEVFRKYKPTQPDPRDAGDCVTPTRAAVHAEVARAIRRAVVETHGLRAYQVILLRPGDILKTSSGKVRRRACRAAFLSGTLMEE